MNSDASIGELWAGEDRFIEALETALGLGGLRDSPVERALGLVSALEGNAGFWEKSVLVDPIGCARRILTLRDELWMCGWRGQGKSKRLRELAAVVKDVRPGRPDRLGAIAEALKTRSAGVERLEILDDPEGLPAVWRAVVAGLQKQGTVIDYRQLKQVEASGDLGASRLKGFVPVGDGSLQLLRPGGQLEAAEHVAAWLSGMSDLSKTVIVWGDAVLDQALHRYGLPTTGEESGINRSALLAVMPLVISLGWEPADPQRAYELLTLPDGPVPGKLARRLADALYRWPAVGGEYWNRRLEKWISRIDDREYLESLKERIGVIFGACVPRDSRYPVEEVVRRLNSLERWLRGRMESGEKDKESWKAAIDQCLAMRRLVGSYGRESLSRMDLGVLVEQAGEAASPPRPWAAQAGVNAVGNPGCVAGEVEHIVWWNFSLSMASPPSKIPLSAGEESELRELGVDLPDPGREAVREAARWRRPLEQASESVLLVCPQKGADGEDNFPHPAWDEIKARLKGRQLESELLSERPRGRKMPGMTRRELLALPRPVEEYRVEKGLVELGERESPSSLGPLIGCPFQYVLENSAGLSSGLPFELPEADDSRWRGNMSHRLIEEVLEILKGGKKLSPQEARDKAGEIFDSDAPRLMAVLFLPGNDTARAELRRAICLATENLVSLLSGMGLEVKEIEERHEDRAMGITVSGKLDLLVGDPDKVIDLKWAGAKWRIPEMEAGTSYQLATYSRLLRPKGKKAFPPVAYYMIRENRMLTTDKKAFPKAEPIDGPGPSVPWAALQKAYAEIAKAIKGGTVLAPVEYKKKPGGDPGKIEDGRLLLPPPCFYCDFECLCKAGGEG